MVLISGSLGSGLVMGIQLPDNCLFTFWKHVLPGHSEVGETRGQPSAQASVLIHRGI